jgi:hypothetical protein
MRVSWLVFAFFLICSSLIGLNAQTFKPFTGLRVLETEHFQIIYPRESEATARTLAGMADGIYDRVSGLLGIDLSRRIPVTITPHTEQFNGYMNPLPYPHIVLYDTPMSIDMTTYENALEGLFLHELTHAVSLSSRSPALDVMHSIFGGWVYLTGLTAPAFMVEGVTVSFESLDGFGRANDPLVQQRLRQAIHEDAFLSPFQAAGVYEYPHAASAHYEYGGLFNAWLQKTYGMEKYAQLWQAMGRQYHFSFFFYNLGYFNSFKDVYGFPFPDAWTAFRESLRLVLIVENPALPVYTGLTSGPLPFPQGGAIINAIAAGGDRIYFLDSLARKALAYDPGSGKIRRAADIDSSAYALDASADGRLLVSSYGYMGKLVNAVVAEYKSGWKLRTWKGLYSARYFRDGVIGLSSDLHNNNLVFRSGSSHGAGEEQLLLRGNEELLYGSPAVINETWIAFIAAKKGMRELCLLNYETRELYTLVSDLPDDEERWRYIRSVQVSGGRLLFTFNHDQGMYRLGMVDVSGIQGRGDGNPPDALPPDAGLPNAMEAIFTEWEFSGAVSLPVMAGDTIYYKGTFAKWDALMRYPEPGIALSGEPALLSPRPWSVEDRVRALPDFRSTPGMLDREPSRKPGAAVSDGVPGETWAASKPYFGISYLNPLKLWFPLPLVRFGSEGNISFDGAGLFSYMSDPTDTNMLFLSAYMDIRSLMAAGSLRWINYGLGFPLEIDVSDDLDKTGIPVCRETRLFITASPIYSLGNRGFRFQMVPSFEALFTAWESGDGSNPYTWDYGEPFYSAGLGLGISSLVVRPWQNFGRGFSLSVYGRYLLNNPGGLLRSVPHPPRVDGLMNAAFEPILPLRIQLYGAWDRDGLDLHGESRYYRGASFSAIASSEYPAQKALLLDWIAGGEGELKLFNLDIQGSLSHLYFNRIWGTLAYRGVFYDDQGSVAAAGDALFASEAGSYRLAQSLVARLGAGVSTILLTALPLSINPYLFGGWRISNRDDTNSNNDFFWGFGFSVSY